MEQKEAGRQQKEVKERLSPLLKWAGGKKWLAPYIAKLYAPYRERRWVEPFAGGMSVALHLLPERALINDINPHLINFYKWVREGLELSLPMACDRKLYYAYRNRFNHLVRSGKGDSKEAAQLFYYLNRTGYNGLCRFNRRGEFNVPFGKYKRVVYERDFSIYRDVFASWEFSCKDFRELELEKEDFVYADPPYDGTFTHYSEQGFTWKDQVDLAKWLASHPGPVVVSNAYTERIVRLYRDLGFSISFLKGPRSIGRNGNRKPAPEMLAVRGV